MRHGWCSNRFPIVTFPGGEISMENLGVGGGGAKYYEQYTENR